MKRVSVLGLGYIGLPTAIIAAQSGYEVSGFDIDQEKIKKINAGDSLIFEPEIADHLWKVLKNQSFKASTDLHYADCFIIAVPTPFKENKTADLSSVFSAAEFIAKRLRPGNLVILESTVPVGTTEKLAGLLEETSGLRVGMDFFIAFCPERVLPGKIFKELVSNDRVIGGICQRSCELASSFYSKFVKGFLHVTDDKTAEMVKLIENSARDVQIAFANQVAGMCEQAGLDPYQVIDLANKHPRIKILSPSCGVGGHCIAVDPWFLIETFPQSTALLKTARLVNDSKPHKVVEQIHDKVHELKGLGELRPRILLLGATYKPDVNDIRESPALKIMQELCINQHLFELCVYDPYVSSHLFAQYGVTSPTDLWKGLNWADIVVILVKHRQFYLLREDVFGGKAVIDTCGLLNDIRNKQAQELLDGAIKTDYSQSKRVVAEQ